MYTHPRRTKGVWYRVGQCNNVNRSRFGSIKGVAVWQSTCS